MTRLLPISSTLENTFDGVTREGNDITFSGVNIHIVNGTGTTYGTVNGLGNLKTRPEREIERKNKAILVKNKKI